MTQLVNKIKKLTLQIEKLEAKTKPLKKKLKQAEYKFYIEELAKDSNYDGYWIWKKCYHHYTLDKMDFDYIKLMVKKGANINFIHKYYGQTTALDCVINNSNNTKYIKELRKLGAKTSEELKINNKN